MALSRVVLGLVLTVTREDYLRYEAAARTMAEAAETPEERKYFLGRADQHRARADAEDSEGLEELQGRAEELLAEFAESLGEARMRQNGTDLHQAHRRTLPRLPGTRP